MSKAPQNQVRWQRAVEGLHTEIKRLPPTEPVNKELVLAIVRAFGALYECRKTRNEEDYYLGNLKSTGRLEGTREEVLGTVSDAIERTIEYFSKESRIFPHQAEILARNLINVLWKERFKIDVDAVLAPYAPAFTRLVKRKGGRRPLKEAFLPAKRRRANVLLVGMLILVLLALPVVMYVSTFGPHLSHDHTRWGEMGSAFAGIYTPIMAGLTLVVLGFQVHLQRQLNDQTETHANIDLARDNVDYHTSYLISYLKCVGTSGNKSGRDCILGFLDLNEIDFYNGNLSLDELDAAFPSVFMAWLAISEEIFKLRCRGDRLYWAAAEAIVLRLQTALGEKTCIALDNFTWVLNRKKDYGFDEIVYSFSADIPNHGRNA